MTTLKNGCAFHQWDRVLTIKEVELAFAFIERGEPILNCDCNVCTGKIAADSSWLQTAPIVAFQATPVWVFDGMTAKQAIETISLGFTHGVE